MTSAGIGVHVVCPIRQWRARAELYHVRTRLASSRARSEAHMASLDSLDDLLQDELKDIYDAEKQLTKALPKLIQKAAATELKDALRAHLEETEEHVRRVEQAFGHLGMPARGR